MSLKKGKNDLKDSFAQGKTPSGQDFEDFIFSCLNLLDQEPETIQARLDINNELIVRRDLEVRENLTVGTNIGKNSHSKKDLVTRNSLTSTSTLTVYGDLNVSDTFTAQNLELDILEVKNELKIANNILVVSEDAITIGKSGEGFDDDLLVIDENGVNIKCTSTSLLNLTVTGDLTIANNILVVSEDAITIGKFGEDFNDDLLVIDQNNVNVKNNLHVAGDFTIKQDALIVNENGVNIGCTSTSLLNLTVSENLTVTGDLTVENKLIETQSFRLKTASKECQTNTNCSESEWICTFAGSKSYNKNHLYYCSVYIEENEWHIKITSENPGIDVDVCLLKISSKIARRKNGTET